MSDRVLVIGLDGATWRALDPLVRSGHMPALGRLVANGFRAPLESTVPPVTAPAWSSFITGQNPGEHGIYQFYEIDPWSERALGRGAETFMAEPGVVVNGRALGGPKLWEVASAAGRRCATVNLPMTYPPSPINGLMVTCMLTPPGSKQFTTPPELALELDEYEIDLTPREKDFSSTDEAFLERAEEVLDKRGRTFVRLLERERWDLFVAIITETDRIQHRFWRYLDPDSMDRYATDETRQRVVALYERLDGYIAQMVEAAGDDCRIVVASDHGFGPAAHRRVNMEALAVALGLASAPSASNRLAQLGITKRRVYKYLGWLVPDGRLRNAERMARDRVTRDLKGKLVKLHDYIGGVWIHRESRGGPIPDSEVAAFRDELIDRLLAVRNPGTDSPLVLRAVPRDQVYHGGRVSAAPDIVFFLDERFGLDPRPREPQLVYRFDPPNSGTHRSDGVLLMTGPGLVSAEPSKTPAIEDVAPTILHLLGLPVPDAMSGRVLEEAFTADLRAERPVTFTKGDFESAGETGDWESVDEEEEIMERLRGIGYLE